MNQDPWAVTTPSPGRYRFTNKTGRPAVMIALKAEGVRLDTGEPGSGVSQRVDPERHFEIRMERLPGASNPAGVKMQWRMPYDDGTYDVGLWGYAI